MTRGAGDRSRLSLGDLAKMATRIIESVEQEPAPRRLVLGSDSQRFIQAALKERLADVETQAETAGLTNWTET
jgi:hypothetical protein